MKRRTVLVRVVASGAVVLVLVALMLGDGNLGGAMRTVTVGRAPSALDIDPQTGHLFVVNTGQRDHFGSVSMLDAASGQVQSTITVGAVPTDVTVDERYRRVFVVNEEGNTVSVLDARSGKVLATLGPYVGVGFRNLTSSIHVATVATTGRTFISTVTAARAATGPVISGTVWVLDTSHTSLLHAIPMSMTPTTLAVDEQTRHVFVLTLGTPTKAGYIGGGVSMLDGTTGAILRRIRLGGMPLAAVMDPRRRHAFVLFESATTTKLSILDTRSGGVVRTLSLGAAAGPMTLHEGTGHLFVAGLGTVLMLDARTGQVLTRTPMSSAVTALASAERAGRVYLVQTAVSRVTVLDARTGAIRRTFGVVQDPTTVAVDERTNRVFVASNDVSDGINSGITGGIRTSHVFATIVSILSNARRLRNKGLTGTVSVFDMHTMQ